MEMPSVQQLKHTILGFLIVFVILSQTAMQVHMSYNYKDKDAITNNSNDQSQSSSPSVQLLDNSDGNRLKRSSLKHKKLTATTDGDNLLLAAKLLEPIPTGSIAPPMSLTTDTAKNNHFLSISTSSSISMPSSSSSPADTDDLSKHVTDWSAIPERLFIKHYYTGNFSLVNPVLCSRKQNLTLLILITSAIGHFDQRNSVRQTWGHFGLRSDVQFAFVIGDSLLNRYNQSIQTAFRTEIDLYDDFIIPSSDDTYRNLAIKTVHMLDWISTYCHTAKYFLKTDDDVFLNVPEILQHIKNVKAADELVPKIYGHVFSGHLPNRNMSHRHSVNFDVYPYTLAYPNFTSGPAYLMSTKIVRPLFEEVVRLPFIPLEDVLTTGFAGMNLRIPRVDIPGFYNEMKNPSEFTACELISILAGMTDGSAVQMNYVWFNYLMGRAVCTWKPKNINTFSI